MRIVDPYNIRPDELKEGDVMLYIVKAEVQWIDSEGRPRYRLYRCWYDGPTDDIPQGTQLGQPKKLAEQLFPGLALVGEPG